MDEDSGKVRMSENRNLQFSFIFGFFKNCIWFIVARMSWFFPNSFGDMFLCNICVSDLGSNKDVQGGPRKDKPLLSRC